jgi:riboflavin synthase
VAVQPKTEHLKQETAFSAAIIPHTYKNTVFSCLKKGDLVNLEFDILAKHIQEVISKSISIK